MAVAVVERPHGLAEKPRQVTPRRPSVQRGPRRGDVLQGLDEAPGWSSANAVFGGTAPLVIQWLPGSTFFFYVAAGAAIAFFVILSMPETKGSELR